MMTGLRGRRSAPRDKPTPTSARVYTACTAYLALIPTALALGAAFAPPAVAAPYSVWACANGSGAPLSVGSWVRSVDAGLADVQATCDEPSAPVGALVARARATSVDRPGGGGWAVAAAHGTSITGLDVWWSWQVPPSASRGAIRVYALGSAFLDPTGEVDPFDGKGRCCSDSTFVDLKTGAFGVPATTSSAAGYTNLNHQSFAMRTIHGHGTPVVGLSADCVSGCASNEVVAQYQAYRVKTVVEDEAPPTGRADGLHDGLRVGVGTPIDVTASDVGGGVRELTLRVDGTVAQRISAEGACADVDPSNSDPLEYNVMKPCPSTLKGQLTLAAAQLPDNEPHEVSVVATDAAGQDTAVSSADVALAAPPGFWDPKNGFYNPDLNVARARQANGSRPDTHAKLTLAFLRGHRTLPGQTIGYTTSARIRGSVRTAGKKPVAGARVWLASRQPGGRWRLAAQPRITSRGGLVSARLRAGEPSRDVRLVYFPFSDDDADAVSPDRALRVQAATTIQSNQGGYRNGDTLTFTGHLISKNLIDDKSIYLQAIVRGTWRTFATTRADSKGRWHMTYRFEATRQPTIYSFRAVVPSEPGYDWATGHSRTLRVLVTP